MPKAGAAPAAVPADREDAKRLALYAAAEPLFERHGYRKTTVEEICHAAGVSKRTFYELFEDKTDLAFRWILHVSMGMAVRWESEVTPALPAREKFFRFIDAYVRLGREHRVFAQMMSDPGLLRAFGRGAEDPRFLFLMDTLRGILEEGVARGEFRRLDPVAVTWIVYSLLDTMYYLVPATGAIAGPFENEPLAAELLAFLTHALLAPNPGSPA